MISTRFKILLLFLSNLLILILPKENYLDFALLIIIYNLFFYKEVIKNLKLIFAYLIGLFIISIIFNSIFNEQPIFNSFLETIKIFAIINISIILITDINIFEMISFLSKLKIPTKIGIALGVGFRYFTLLLDDIKKINFSQTSKGLGLSFKSFKNNGFQKPISIFILPLFLSLLKRTENLTLSIILQDIENRTLNYKFSKSTIKEITLVIVTIFFFVKEIYKKLN